MPHAAGVNPNSGDSAGYKARPCRNFPLGLCTFGARCRFLHAEDDPRAGAAAAGGGFAHHRMAEGDPRPRKSYIIAECEAEAKADAASGFCEFMQALAVRLALRFESRPAGILSSMAEAGLPAAKDQRSTVKAIMRLCHPDKCKHPEAKRAMQILSPLL